MRFRNNNEVVLEGLLIMPQITPLDKINSKDSKWLPVAAGVLAPNAIKVKH